MRRPMPRSPALEQRREDLDDSAHGAGGEIRHLRRRHGRRRVGEEPRPADVVDVVPGPVRVPALCAETRDRAVDGALGHA